MFKLFKDLISKRVGKGDASQGQEPVFPKDMSFTPNIETNLDNLKKVAGGSADFVFREFVVGKAGIKCGIMYVDGLIDRLVIHDQIMDSAMVEATRFEDLSGVTLTKGTLFDYLFNRGITVADMKIMEKFSDAIDMVMSGEVLLIVDGTPKCMIISARGWASRGITEPVTEGVIQGPRDGFTETLRTNTSLLRRRCKDPNMIIKTIKLGRRSKTDVCYVFIKGIVKEGLIDELEERLSKIDIDLIFESGQVDQLIEDDSISPFPQSQLTERPDKVVAAIAEGRAAILVDGTPFAIIIPTTLYQFLQSPEDYYDRWIIGSFIRALRFFATFIAALGPSLYIAIVSFHPGMIPTELALSIAGAREGVPFPAIVEASLMEITIELLREAGARLPKPIGQTVGIVGGLIVGEAAVRAGIVSPILVIVAALTAIATFVIPTYSAAVSFRLVRFPLMVMAAIFGLYGVMLGFIMLNIHLVTLKSFGVNYLSPQTPFQVRDWKDTVLRFPSKYMFFRPSYTEPVDMVRMSFGKEESNEN
jgi:spore germination protein